MPENPGIGSSIVSLFLGNQFMFVVLSTKMKSAGRKDLGSSFWGGENGELGDRGKTRLSLVEGVFGLVVGLEKGSGLIIGLEKSSGLIIGLEKGLGLVRISPG